MQRSELVSGAYLTDGKGLYEIVQVFAEDAVLVLENCVDGCWMDRPIGDLVAAGWRKITPESGV